MPSLPKIPKLVNTAKIPILNIPDTPLVGRSQEYVPVADIVDNIVIYKTGGAAIVLESSSLNFGLLSEGEQDAVISSFAAFINSLSFAIQFLVRTQIKDISNYIKFVDEAMAKVENPRLRELMMGYKRFISETITKRNVLGKRFFVILPLSPYELGVSKSFKSFTRRSGPLPYSKEYIVKKAKVVLYPRRDHIARQAARLGLRLKPLNKEELVKLYYEVYNPNIETVRVKNLKNTGSKKSSDE